MQTGPPLYQDMFVKIVELDHRPPPSSSFLHALRLRTRLALSSCSLTLFLATSGFGLALSCWPLPPHLPPVFLFALGLLLLRFVDHPFVCLLLLGLATLCCLLLLLDLLALADNFAFPRSVIFLLAAVGLALLFWDHHFLDDLTALVAIVVQDHLLT